MRDEETINNFFLQFQPNVYHRVSMVTAHLQVFVHATLDIMDLDAIKVEQNNILKIVLQLFQLQNVQAYCKKTCIHGTCTAPGICTCNSGYSGPTCDKSFNRNFGSWYLK